MVKITQPDLNVGIAKIPLGYAEASPPNLQPVAAGLQELGQAFARVEAEQKAKADTMKRYNALSSFNDFEVNSKLKAQQTLDAADPADTGTAQKIINDQIAYENEFIKTLPPDLQPEFKVRADSVRGGITLSAHDSQDKLNNAYYKNDIKKGQNEAVIQIEQDPNWMEKKKAEIDQRIDASGLSESEKYFAKQENARLLETAGYGATVKRDRLANVQYTNDLAAAATQAARQLGISPVDLLTVMSYETGGTFNVNQKGGAGGKYLGLIQFGPEEQRKYGVHPGMSVGEQMQAVVNFLQDRGFKPGMTIYDLYSTINAGSPGHYNASDAHNGGAPGTVADKVRTQMGDHRAKAEALLGGKFEVPSTIDSDPRFSNVLYEDRVALQHDAEVSVNQMIAQQNAERKAQQEAQFNELMNGINDGRYGASSIEAGREQGWLTDYDQIAKAQALLEKKTKDANDLRDLSARIQRGDAFDPSNEADKKNFNNLNQQAGGEDKLQTMDTGYIEQTIAPLFRQTGMIAPDVVHTLANMGNSNDGRKMNYAYTALNDLEEQNPAAYIKNVPEDVRKRADQFQVLVAGTDVKTALEWMSISPDPTIRAAQAQIRTEAEKALADPNSKVKFQNVLDAFDAEQASPGLKGAAMEQEWKTLVAENMVHGRMSLEQAGEVATTQLKRVWGKTNFGGTSTLMRLPPEKYAPNIGDGGAYMERQARADFALKPDEQMALVSDQTTEAEVAAGKNPSWIMMIQSPDGTWRPAMGPASDGSGTQVFKRMQFEPTAADKELRNKGIALEQLQNEITVIKNSAQRLGRSGTQALPPALQKTLEAKEAQLEALKGVHEATKQQTESQYRTPEAEQLAAAQKQIAPLETELQGFAGTMTYDEAMAQWKKADEYRKLKQEILRLTPIVQDQAAAQRKAQGVDNAGN